MKTRNVKPAKEIRVSCRAPQELLQRINAAAKSKGISQSDVVRMAINEYLPQHEKQAA